MRGGVQRICDDVPQFAEGSVILVIGVIKQVFSLAAFSGKHPKPEGLMWDWLCGSLSFSIIVIPSLPSIMSSF